jgi:hypothetical protein
MNNARRKEITTVLEAFKKLDLEEARNSLQEVIDAETEAYEAMPEGLQSGPRGEKSQECIQWLESFISTLDTLETELEGLSEAIDPDN